ncbi:MAG: hypothetical protein HBSAPP03_25230 [Phycisphaerae bacterium]|nr:MAG: hypothetical protein HBSAPP03_25230 [Phycisphaerae bacterium]
MSAEATHATESPTPPVFDRRRLLAVHPLPTRRGLLAGMRIRKKLIVLHTLFSLVLAIILMVLLRPAVNAVVVRAEQAQARVLLDIISAAPEGGDPSAGPMLERIRSAAVERRGTVAELGMRPEAVQAAMASGGRAVVCELGDGEYGAAQYIPSRDGRGEMFRAIVVRNTEAREAVTRVYLLVAAALVGVYALVAAALEVFVLPQGVYEPIRRMLAAERAVQDGRTDEELIPETAIPADELGEIMRSRNDSIVKLRMQEAALEGALARLESVATDLRRKNHLLEAARRNLADADRLASLGMMSAGIAHELNTPLAVLKGLVERLNAEPGRTMEPAQAALMLRVVTRLERLGDGLLDFARVRPPRTTETVMRTVIQEAVTLIRLERESSGVEIQNAISELVVAECDADRMVQVFVNLIRNGTEAVRAAGARGLVTIEGETTSRDRGEWVSIRVIDNGPGIDTTILPRLFEPFASTRLDARGTGLGLAVAEGIVREHGGVILARNRPGTSGAIFEVMIPAHQRPTPEVGDPLAPNVEHAV